MDAADADAKRTPLAALRITCDLVDEGLIDPDTAVERLAGYDLDAISTARLDTMPPQSECGLPAGNGVVSGRAALSDVSARRLAGRGDPVILLRAPPDRRHRRVSPCAQDSSPPPAPGHRTPRSSRANSASRPRRLPRLSIDLVDRLRFGRARSD